MKRFITVVALAVVCCFAADLYAQGGVRRNKEQRDIKKAQAEAEKNRKEQAAKAKKNAEQAEREAEKEEAREERDARRNGEEEEDGIGIVGGDAGADEVAEPGSTISRAIKDETLEKVMDELKLEDKNKRAKFKSEVRGAWDDCEKEDKRYALTYKRYMDNAEKLATEKKVHQDKLTKIWEESDEKLTKDEVLDADQMTRWKKASAELREKSATDRYYEAKNKPVPEEPKKEKKEEGDD